MINLNTPFPISHVTWTLVCPGQQSTFRILPLRRRGPVAIYAQRRIPRLARSWRPINGKFARPQTLDGSVKNNVEPKQAVSFNIERTVIFGKRKPSSSDVSILLKRSLVGVLTSDRSNRADGIPESRGRFQMTARGTW